MAAAGGDSDVCAELYSMLLQRHVAHTQEPLTASWFFF